MNNHLSESFFNNFEQSLWQAYRKAITQTRSKKLLFEGCLLGSDINQNFKKYYFQVYVDHLVRYEDYREYKTNEVKAMESAKIMMLNHTSLEVYELATDNNICAEMRYSLLLSQNTHQFFLCPKDEDEMLLWFEKLKQCCIVTHFQNVYKIQEKIGQGAFAQVYRAIRSADGQQFAVKIFDKQKVLKNKNHELHMKAIKKEIQIMRLFDSPLMLQLHEIYQTGGNLYMVMELMEGIELFDKIVKKGPFREKDACIVMKQLLNSVQYLHSLNVIHRDIKPENIMFTNKKNLEIKIVDFGLAEFVNDPEVLFKRSGTPGYVGPEILRDRPYDTQSDVFSTGVIMYQILTGCTPFFGDNLDEVVLKNISAQVCYDFREINIEVSNQGLDLMKQMLKQNPDARYSASKAMQHLWITKFTDIKQEST